MRKVSRVMIGVLLGATVLAPIAAGAQERGRGRGGDGSMQRGGGGDGGARGGGWQRGSDGGGWQRGGGSGGGGAGIDAGQRSAGGNAGVDMGRRGGGNEAGQPGPWQGGAWQGGGDRGRGGRDRGASMNGDAARDAVQQGREAQRQVERPAPVIQPQVAGSDGRGRWRGDNGDARRGDDGRRDGDRRRDWDRNRDGNRDGNRWTGERRDWNREGNRNWSSDRRDWDRRDNRSWSRDWRSDRRYGWQNYRNSNRNIYRLPRYEARHGYSYRRWYPGYRWDSWFYSSSFWISDPWQYRLPPAYGPYRWVRYYDDVVLVDIDTGEIVDIIYDFFW